MDKQVRGIVVDKTTPFGKEASKSSHLEAKKLLEECEEFVLIGVKKGEVICLSGVSALMVPFVLEAMDTFKEATAKVEKSKVVKMVNKVEEKWKEIFKSEDVDNYTIGG